MGTDLLKRYCDPEIREFLLCVTLLDPRFKSLHFCINEEKSQVYDKVTHMAANAFPNQSRPTQELFLAYTTTRASSERIFSTAGDIVIVPADRV